MQRCATHTYTHIYDRITTYVGGCQYDKSFSLAASSLLSHSRWITHMVDRVQLKTTAEIWILLWLTTSSATLIIVHAGPPDSCNQERNKTTS